MDLINGNKMITEYRDKMLIERNNILNEFAKQTLKYGEMYFVYSENSKLNSFYNICICKDEMSNVVIEEEIEKLPIGTKIGSVLRKRNNEFFLDEIATNVIERKLNKMINEILEEQENYLESKRIEGHTYEVAENEGDRVLLFDLTSNDNEGIEEIDFPPELLKEAKEGDLFIWANGYKKT